MDQSVYDRMINADGGMVSKLTISLLNSMQKQSENPGAQMASVSALVTLMAERFDISPMDVFVVGQNVVRRSDQFTKRKQFQATREYLRNEI